MSSPNPFGGPNPFADPAVTVHTESTAAEDDNNYGVRPAATSAWGSNPSAWGSTVPISQNGTATATEIELGKREAEIKQREKQLEKQQRELHNRQRADANQTARPFKNWPPCAPVLYHDIEAEIPVRMQSVVKRGYYTYLVFCLTVVFNFLCVTLALGKGDSDILDWVFSGVYALAGVPGAFLLWYGRLYNAAAYDRSITFMCFFAGNGIHIGFCVWAAVAVPIGRKASFVGILQVFDKFDSAPWLGIFYLIGFALWVGCVVLSVYVWQQAMREFRGHGGPEQVQNEVRTATGRAILSSATGSRI